MEFSSIQAARTAHLDYVLIFEDDAILRTSVEEIIKVVENLSCQFDWEILLLSINNGAHLLYTYLDPISDRHIFAVPGIVNHSAFDKLIAKLEEVETDPNLDVDLDIYTKICEGKIFVTVPFMAEVLPTNFSDINSNRNPTDEYQNIL